MMYSLRTFLLEKAIYELGYELNGRPDWTIIPLRGIFYLMKSYQEEKDESRRSKGAFVIASSSQFTDHRSQTCG